MRRSAALLLLGVTVAAAVSAAVAVSSALGRPVDRAPVVHHAGGAVWSSSDARAAAPFRFAAPKKVATGKDPVVALTDVTGDGCPDLVTCGEQGVGVLPEGPGGSFGPLVRYFEGQSVRAVRWADVNGDAFDDMLAALGAELQVKLGTADGYGGPVVSTTSTDTVSFDAGDVNGDGRADIVEGSSDGHTRRLSLQLGAGDGTFGPPAAIDVPFEAFSPRLVDLDGDGHLDLVVYVNEFEEEYGAGVLLGDGKGGFGAMVTYNVGRNLEPADIEVGDMNGDDVPDLVLDMTLEGDTDLGILLGKGDGTFRQARKSSVWSFHPDSYSDAFFSIALGDFDGDGKTDVAAGKRRQLMVVRCDGGGFLKSQLLMLKDLKYPDVFAGDVNGDSRVDLVSAYSGTANVRLNAKR